MPVKPRGLWQVSLGVVRVLLAMLFFAAGTAKLVGVPQMVEGFELIGLGQWFRFVTGTVEIVGATFLLTHKLVSAGALLLSCTMVGATIAHLTRAPGSPVPAVVLLMPSVLLAVSYRHRLRGYLQTKFIRQVRQTKCTSR